MFCRLFGEAVKECLAAEKISKEIKIEMEMSYLLYVLQLPEKS